MRMRFKQVTLSLFFIGLSTTAWSQPVLLKSEQKIEEYTLDNGFRVILAQNNKENKVFMNTIYLTGSLNDPQGKGGLAHLLEHLAFKGTQNVQGEEFQRRLDQYTLMTNASTDYYSTQYTNIIRPEQTSIDQVIHLEAERMDKLVLQEKFVPSEISIVKREREVRMDQPFSVMMDQIWKSAYGNQYLGRLPIGDLNELQSIKMDELKQFYRTWYAPNNAVMVISGKFDKAEVLKQLDQNFSPIAARKIPTPSQVPELNSSHIQQREFLVQKGSDFAKFNLYLNGKNEKIKSVLALSPALYSMQPSGHLYQSMVETGMSTGVQASTWLDQDFNLVFMGAIYAPNHDPKKVESELISAVEKDKPFNATELNRVKNLIQNQADSILSNATALGGRLSDYYVSNQGDWTQYFSDLDNIKNLKLDEVNRALSAFLVPEHRISGDIQPTPDDQKKALAQKNPAQPAKTLDQTQLEEAPLKDRVEYQYEVAEYVKTSKKYLLETEKKIQRGALKNGIQYALYPTSTRDDKTYATISVDFGTEKSLFNQGEVLDLMAYLMLRGSDQYSLQDIADQSIAAGGGATAVASGNSITIHIVAKKDKFEAFFKFMLAVLKNPKFEQSQFDLIQSQSLSALNRPYTEPETVAALTISRLLETYQPGDLRYHFEPELAKQQMKAASVEKVKQLYQKFFISNHARIAMTGDYQAPDMLKLLQKEFGAWTTKLPYQRLSSDYQAYAAQKIHALSEQREFGNYQAILTFPVGADHVDAPALMVFRYILGDSQLSSRLAQELREKNALVYGFGSDLNLDDWINSGALTIEANYTAGKSLQVSQGVAKVLKDLLSQGVTEQELEAAKANLLKKRVTVLEDERNIHQMLSPQLEQQRDLLFREKRDQALAKLTKADVDAVIKKYIQLDHLVEVMADQYGKPQPK